MFHKISNTALSMQSLNLLTIQLWLTGITDFWKYTIEITRYKDLNILYMQPELENKKNLRIWLLEN